MKESLKECPCCQSKTIGELNSNELCIACWWEHEGQNDTNADEVFGGPNGSVSLSKARINFKKYGIFDPNRRDLIDFNNRKKNAYKIYFAGSIRGGRNDKEKYKQIIECLKEYGTVLTEHIGLDSLTSNGQTQFSEERIYRQDTDWVRESDIVIAEVTQVSLGVGYELGFAESLGKRVICLFDTSSEKSLSAMVRGNKKLEVIDYNNFEEIPKILKQIFK
jgi:nucleoside 2-deoxyribosyltransferase